MFENRVKFDIQQDPPTREVIEAAQNRLEQQRERAKGVGRWLRWVGGLIGVLLLLLLLALWAAGYAEVGGVILVVALAFVFTFAVVVGTYLVVDWSAVVLPMLVFAIALVIAQVVTLSVASALAGAGAIAIASAGVVVGALLREKWIDVPRMVARFGLADLVALDASDSPHMCLALNGWCEQDETVRKYLEKVKYQGRKLVMGDYKAASRWMAEAEQQAKIEKARQACERMGVV